MSTRPQDLVRPEVLALTAYHVPPATGMIKLDAMENPYHLPERLRDALADIVHGVSLNRYPDASCSQLKGVLRRAFDVPEASGLVLGNGSDELIQIVAMALAKPGAVLVAPEPSFVMYRQIAAFCGLRYVGVPLREDFSLDLSAMLEVIGREQPAAVFLAYPNNPTGNLFPAGDVEAIIRATPGVVVVDEAYAPFASTSFMSRVPEFANLVVMRTVSKMGLAALRLGYMVGAPAWMDEFEKLRLPYNISALSQAIANRLLDEREALDNQAAAIVAERARVQRELAAIKGVTVFPSQANFLLFRLPEAARIHAGLKSRRILIKNLDGSHPMLADCLRVTVGTPTENDAFLSVLGELV